MTTARIWQLLSEGGTLTECHLDRIHGGAHQLTIFHNGSVAASETYASEVQARARAWELNRALVARGWSEEPGGRATT
jgi:hypothetical protein